MKARLSVIVSILTVFFVISKTSYGCGGGGGYYPPPPPPPPPVCDPPCDNCHTCINGKCENKCYVPGMCGCCGGECYDGENACCEGTICDDPDAQCCDGTCCESCCDNKECYDDDTKYCCEEGNGHTCDKGKTCCNGNCCDPANCETCVDGECKVCGGDPNQKCCNSSCCNKVWTTHTTEAITTNCPSCGSGPAGEGLCGGTTTELESYEECRNVGVGQGEHCQCNSSLQPVGFTYPCRINWDLSMMAWCLAQGSWCAAECYLFRDPAGCGNCLAGVNCCSSPPCELCDFVEKCEKNPYYPDPQESLVFTSFGC